MSNSEKGKVAEAEVSDGQKEGKLWRGMTHLHLRDGSVWTVVKVVMVTRYTLLVRVTPAAAAAGAAAGKDEQNQVLLIPKHAIDWAVMKPLPEQGVIAPL